MSTSGTLRSVTVVGAGRMGGALVRSLAAAGHAVAVWNRDHAKAAATEAHGAKAMSTLDDAVAASPCVILCLSDYATCSGVLAGLKAGALQGKTVLQLTTGSPEEAEAFAAELAAAGAAGLDGAIMSYPKQVGTADCRLVMSGPRAVFDDIAPILEAMGVPVYIDANPGSASAMDAAILFYNYGATFAYFQGVALLMAAGVDWARFADLIFGSQVIAEVTKAHGAAIVSRDHAGSEATLDVHFAALQGIVEAAEALKIPHQFMSAVKGQFERALQAGHGADELSAVFEVFRPTDGT